MSWHVWFAWRPVYVNNRWVWWRHIYRAWDWDAGDWIGDFSGYAFPRGAWVYSEVAL